MDPRRAEKELDRLSRQFRKAHIGAPLLVAGGEDIINCFLNATPACRPAQASSSSPHSEQTVQDKDLGSLLSLGRSNVIVKDKDLGSLLPLVLSKQIGNERSAHALDSQRAIVAQPNSGDASENRVWIPSPPGNSPTPLRTIHWVQPPDSSGGSRKLKRGRHYAECKITLSQEWHQGTRGAKAPTQESVEDTALDLSLSLGPTNKTIEDVDLNLSLSLPHYKQIDRDIAMNWGLSLSLAPTTQIARYMDWGLSLSLGPTKQADPVPQPRVGFRNLRPGGPCAECGITVTPEWRRGPLGARTLCNRCGIRFGRQNRNRNRNRNRVN